MTEGHASASTQMCMAGVRPRFSSRLAILVLLDQRFGRNPQFAMQAPDHLEGERTLAAEDLVDAVELADHGHEIPGAQTRLLHPELDGFHRVRQIHRKVRSEEHTSELQSRL